MSRVTLFAVLFSLTVAFTSAHAGEELLRNGDFSRGSSGWKGDRHIETDDDDNKFNAVEAESRDIVNFRQEDLDVEDMKDLVLTFKYKTSDDYKGRGIQLNFVRPTGGYTYRTIPIARTSEWKEYTWKFARTKDSDELTLKIEVLEGEGTIMFDDFSLTAK